MGDRPTVCVSPQLLFGLAAPPLSPSVSGGGPQPRFQYPVEGKYACIWCLSRAKHYILYHFVRCLALPIKLLVLSVLGGRRPVYYVNSALFSTRTADSSQYLVISFCLAAPHRRSLLSPRNFGQAGFHLTLPRKASQVNAAIRCKPVNRGGKCGKRAVNGSWLIHGVTGFQRPASSALQR